MLRLHQSNAGLLPLIKHGAASLRNQDGKLSSPVAVGRSLSAQDVKYFSYSVIHCCWSDQIGTVCFNRRRGKDFSVGGAKKLFKKNDQIQNIILCNAYFFEEGTCIIQWDWGLDQSPRSWGIFENFCVKSNLTVCKVILLIVSYRENWGSRMYYLLPNNFVGRATAPAVALPREQLLPLPPGSRLRLQQRFLLLHSFCLLI